MLHVPAGTKNDGAHKVIMTLGASSCGCTNSSWIKLKMENKQMQNEVINLYFQNILNNFLSRV